MVTGLENRYIKSSFTPMEINSIVLPLYTEHRAETGFFESYPKCFAIERTEPISTLRKIFIENKKRKYIKLYNEFLEKWNTKQMHFGNFQQGFIFEKIKEVIDGILSLNPNYVTFDLTEDASVFFQSSVE